MPDLEHQTETPKAGTERVKQYTADLEKYLITLREDRNTGFRRDLPNLREFTDELADHLREKLGIGEMDWEEKKGYEALTYNNGAQTVILEGTPIVTDWELDTHAFDVGIGVNFNAAKEKTIAPAMAKFLERFGRA